MKACFKNNSMFWKKNWDKKTHLSFLECSHIHSEFSSQELIFWNIFWQYELDDGHGVSECMSEIHCMHVVIHQYLIYRFTESYKLYNELTHGPYLSWKKKKTLKDKTSWNKTLIISKVFSDSIQRILFTLQVFNINWDDDYKIYIEKLKKLHHKAFLRNKLNFT